MGGFGVIQRWKIARELDRTAQQLKAIAGLFWEPFVQWDYDRKRSTRLKITPGDRPLRDKVLIYLIFQPGNILNSTIETCELFEEQGYSTLIVSNTPLTAESLSRLGEVSWQVMERPNYGYDFGGYRDGILYLTNAGISPNWLMVMNDSIWCPLRVAGSLVRRLENSGLDVSGTVVHRNFHKTLMRRRTTRVIESYLFLFSAKAIQSQAFRSFWLNYRMSSIKYNAVHRGERQVAETMLAAGLTADGLFGREEFLTLIGRKEPEYLKKALQYSNSTTVAFEASRKTLLEGFSDTQEWRDLALAHVKTVTGKHSFLASFPFVAAGELKVPLIKRTSATLQVMARNSVVAAIRNGDLLPFRESVMSEMTASEPTSETGA